MKKFKFSSLFLVLSLACVGQQNFFGIETSFLVASKFYYQDFSPLASAEINFYYNPSFDENYNARLDKPNDYAIQEHKTFENSTNVFFSFGLGKKKLKKLPPFFLKPISGYSYTNIVLFTPNVARTKEGDLLIFEGTLGGNKFIQHQLQAVNLGLHFGWHFYQHRDFVLSTSIGLEKKLLIKEITVDGENFGELDSPHNTVYQKLPFIIEARLEGAYLFSHYRKKNMKKLTVFVSLSAYNEMIQDEEYWNNYYRRTEGGTFFLPEGSIVRENNTPQFYLSAGLAFGFGKIK